MIRHARMRGHRDPVPAGSRPRLDRRPVRARRHPRRGRREPPVARPGALPRADARVRRRRRAPVMLGQQRRVGASADWGRLRYTMDDGSAKAVRVAFDRLYRDGLAYRTEALVNWCPGCRTSVSDLEVVPTPETGHPLDGPLPPDRCGDGPADPDADDRCRHDPARDDPGRHRRRRPSRRRALPRPRRRARSGSRSSSATCRSSPTTSSSATSGPAP